mmetsp:Transcript_33888/g.37452  ORF Transcript_33888/g.37452 Transcript_33888/m.37452 type:complete len:136 (-) Transcript_33888:27-434(-)
MGKHDDDTRNCCPYWTSYIEPSVWTCACLGSAMKWLQPEAPPYVNATLFILQGWAVSPCFPTLFQEATRPQALGLVFGGIFVTLGAIAYSLQWPFNTLQKRQRDIVFGPHEVFHCGTLLMILSFYYTMWNKVLSS